MEVGDCLFTLNTPRRGRRGLSKGLPMHLPMTAPGGTKQ